MIKYVKFSRTVLTLVLSIFILGLNFNHLLSADEASAAKQDFGTFYIDLGSDPVTLNPITYSDAYAPAVNGYIFDSLLNRDDNSYEWIPCLAEKWKVSKDGTVFTFTLRDGVKWSDGQPLTAEDVKYSFDVYFEGRFNGSALKSYLEGIKEVKIIDPKTVQFTTKEVYFKNFEVAAGLNIYPKHYYSVGDPADPKFNKEVIGTGPYILSEWTKGQRIILKKNPDYWGKNLKYYKDRYHFQKIFFRPVKEETVSLELLKKGDLDFIPLTPEQYVQKTKGPEWQTKVEAVKVTNSTPQSYGFLAWNNTHPFFKDRDVRMAMSHLINRDFMIEKFLFGLSEKATGPYGNRSQSSSPKVKPVNYDPNAALALLKKSGWTMGPKGLTKIIDGNPTLFEFTLLSANPDFEKYLTVIKEDMQKVGITMNIKTIEWNSFVKLLDERKFDAMTLAWSGGDQEQDQKQIYHSDSIPSPGSNFIGYSNPKVDALIMKIRSTMDKKKRLVMEHELHELIADDQPYSFLFNRKFVLYANTRRMHKLRDTFKYGIGVDTWWLSPTQE